MIKIGRPAAVLIGLAAAIVPATAVFAAPTAPAPTPTYNSLLGSFSGYLAGQAFNGTQIEQFGNAVTLHASTRSVSKVVVSMSNFWPSAFKTPVTVSFYKPGLGGTVGKLLTSVTETIAVPFGASAGTYFVDGITLFNATFTGFKPAVVLPSHVVVGISLAELNEDCANYTPYCGNDPNPWGSLNVNLSTEPTNVSVGADTNPGNLYVEENPAVSGTAAGSEITCNGLVSPETFIQYSTAAGTNGSGACGYGTATAPPLGGFYGNIPAVEIFQAGKTT
jgi:hypothetical protein